MHQFIYRVTYLTYTLFCTSITLLSLSIAALVLQTKVLHVFRGLQIQMPGSALIEWEFVSLNPPYLDNGPMIATLVVAVCGILSCVATMSWISGIWGRWCSKTTVRSCAYEDELEKGIKSTDNLHRRPSSASQPAQCSCSILARLSPSPHTSSSPRRA
jgi:hypothetical protein